LIISHKYKFIFLKTGKTAGTSIEIALSKFCCSGDIITNLDPEDEEIRRKLGYRSGQNYKLPFSQLGKTGWKRLLVKRRRLKYYNHISGHIVRKYIGEEKWNSYFKFCVVRNPWDYFISLYYWRNQSEPRPSISEFLESKRVVMRHKKNGIDVYTMNGKIIVDRVCLYENLEEDLEQVRIRCGLPEKLKLPHAKGSYRRDRRSYREILNEEQEKKIREMSSREIALFGYEF